MSAKQRVLRAVRAIPADSNPRLSGHDSWGVAGNAPAALPLVILLGSPAGDACATGTFSGEPANSSPEVSHERSAQHLPRPRPRRPPCAADTRRPRPVRLNLESLDQRIVPSSSSSNIHAVTDGTGASVAFFKDVTGTLREKNDLGLLQPLGSTPNEVSVFSAGLDQFSNADVFAVRDGKLEYLTNAGGGWQDTMAPVAERSFAAVKGGRMYLVGTDDSLWEYTAPFTTTGFLYLPGHAPVPVTTHWAGKWQELLGPNSMDDVDAVTTTHGFDVLFGRDANFNLSEFIPGTTSHLITLTTASTSDYSAGLDVGGFAEVFAVFPNLSNGRQADLKEYDAGTWTEIYNRADEFTLVSATSGGQAYFTVYQKDLGSDDYFELVMGYDPKTSSFPNILAPMPPTNGFPVQISAGWAQRPFWNRGRRDGCGVHRQHQPRCLADLHLSSRKGRAPPDCSGTAPVFVFEFQVVPSVARPPRRPRMASTIGGPPNVLSRRRRTSPASSRKRAPSRRRRSSPPRPTSRAWPSTKSSGSAAKDDPEGFWAEQAESLHWFKRWDKVLDWNEPHAQWFVGGKLNASYNCLDRHLAGPRRNKAAIIWEGEPGDSRVLTYQMLHREVCKFANVLKGLGIKPGDRVTIYMPMVPELAIAMLACARIGATHSVVFGGFSADAVADRNNDAKAKLRHHRRRRLAARQGRAAQAERRSAPWPSRRPSRSASSSTAATSRWT